MSQQPAIWLWACALIVTGIANPVAGDDGRAVSINGAPDHRRGIALATGIEATAAATMSGNADLEVLSLSGIEIGSFSPDKVSYAARVGNEINETRVTAEPADANAEVSIDPEAEVELIEGSTLITITVTAENSTEKTYTVTVVREPGTAAALAEYLIAQIPAGDLSAMDGDGDSSVFLPMPVSRIDDLAVTWSNPNTSASNFPLAIRNDFHAGLYFGLVAKDIELTVTVTAKGQTATRSVVSTIPAARSRTDSATRGTKFVLSVADRLNGKRMNSALWRLTPWYTGNRDNLTEVDSGILRLRTLPAEGNLPAGWAVLLARRPFVDVYLKIRMRLAKYEGKISSVYYFPRDVSMAHSDSTKGMELDVFEYRYEADGLDRCQYQVTQHMHWNRAYETMSGEQSTITRESHEYRQNFGLETEPCRFAQQEKFIEVEHLWMREELRTTISSSPEEGSSKRFVLNSLLANTKMCGQYYHQSDNEVPRLKPKGSGHCGEGSLQPYPRPTPFPSFPRVPQMLLIGGGFFSKWAGSEDATPEELTDDVLVDSIEVWLQASQFANLGALSLSGIDIGSFSSDTTTYAASVSADVAATTVRAKPSFPSATAIISDDDGETADDERTVDLSVGVNEIEVTVTAADGLTTRTYEVEVTRAPPETNTALKLDTVVVDRNELVLTFDTALDEGSVPAPGDFIVTSGAGDAVDVVGVEVRGSAVTLNLGGVVAHGVQVTVSYTPGASPLRDIEGNSVPSIADETAVEVFVSITAARAAEGDDVVFPVRLSRAVGSAVTVAWTVGDGTATAGSDYPPGQAGSVTVAGGATEENVTVLTSEDTTVESDETFVVMLAEPPDFPVWAQLDRGQATGTIVNDDSRPPPPPGGGGGAANRPPVVERPIEDQTLDVGDILELDISRNFYDRDQRALDYSVESAHPAVAAVAVDRNGVLTIRGLARGVTSVTLTAADRRDERVSQSFRVTVSGPALVALFPRASDPVREGFARVINHSVEDGEVSIEAIDDRGMRAGPVVLTLDGGAIAHFNSDDLEDGNPAKGLVAGVGSGEGDWRLVVDSELGFDVLAYTRTEDGFLTSMHDLAPATDGVHHIATFNPGSNLNQVSRLRLVNPGEETAAVSITGIDDAGASPGNTVELDIPARESVSLTAAELESGSGIDGALGDGTGKWRLAVSSEQPIVAMSLLESPTGHLTNLSTVPRAPADGDRGHLVPLFPSASDALGRQGFVRVANRTDEAGEVRIEAYADSHVVYNPLTLAIDAGETVHFNSYDLELGNASKGLMGNTGAGAGAWRLVLTSDLEIEVLAYIRTRDGFLTSMHDVTPSLDGEYWVAIFNPGSNPNQVSWLRLVNPGTEDAELAITGIDDAGASPGGSVTVTVPAGASRTIAAADLEAGAEGFEGALGDGDGKWRLAMTSEQPMIVISLLSSPTGHLTNLSTAPDRGGT